MEEQVINRFRFREAREQAKGERLIWVDSLDNVEGRGVVPGYFPKESLNLGGDERKPNCFMWEGRT